MLLCTVLLDHTFTLLVQDALSSSRWFRSLWKLYRSVLWFFAPLLRPRRKCGGSLNNIM